MGKPVSLFEKWDGVLKKYFEMVSILIKYLRGTRTQILRITFQAEAFKVLIYYLLSKLQVQFMGSQIIWTTILCWAYWFFSIQVLGTKTLIKCLHVLKQERFLNLNSDWNDNYKCSKSKRNLTITTTVFAFMTCEYGTPRHFWYCTMVSRKKKCKRDVQIFRDTVLAIRSQNVQKSFTYFLRSSSTLFSVFNFVGKFH